MHLLLLTQQMKVKGHPNQAILRLLDLSNSDLVDLKLRISSIPIYYYFLRGTRPKPIFSRSYIREQAYVFGCGSYKIRCYRQKMHLKSLIPEPRLISRFANCLLCHCWLTFLFHLMAIASFPDLASLFPTLELSFPSTASLIDWDYTSGLSPSTGMDSSPKGTRWGSGQVKNKSTLLISIGVVVTNSITKLYE